MIKKNAPVRIIKFKTHNFYRGGFFVFFPLYQSWKEKLWVIDIYRIPSVIYKFRFSLTDGAKVQ